MNINQLNGTGIFPLPSTTISVAPEFVSGIDIARPAAPTMQPRIGNKSESEEQIKQAVQKIQETVDNLAHNLRFSIDEDTGRTVIKVMDAHTEEIIRQIPTKEAIEIARTLDKVQGLLFSDKA
ncbi:flagellar protein FlaG [Nitrosomonas sp. Nm84]|uniref:flagellar protein FlaG n=1 Tax=Nitrosomonas sp. Nm84 TaxID=200124 RepID=UPI000D759EFE|nr:flagellar protein FlaG [Nitrosomonas sp. Nm84]PXW87303.1 flagellar protein FlaG [Nitrosomonas sp. Nm84]